MLGISSTNSKAGENYRQIYTTSRPLATAYFKSSVLCESCEDITEEETQAPHGRLLCKLNLLQFLLSQRSGFGKRSSFKNLHCCNCNSNFMLVINCFIILPVAGAMEQ